MLLVMTVMMMILENTPTTKDETFSPSGSGQSNLDLKQGLHRNDGDDDDRKAMMIIYDHCHLWPLLDNRLWLSVPSA